MPPGGKQERYDDVGPEDRTRSEQYWVAGDHISRLFGALNSKLSDAPPLGTAAAAAATPRRGSIERDARGGREAARWWEGGRVVVTTGKRLERTALTGRPDFFGSLLRDRADFVRLELHGSAHSEVLLEISAFASVHLAALVCWPTRGGVLEGDAMIITCKGIRKVSAAAAVGCD
ncbi:hypothetical protein AXG93_1593s1300 [Marchantia polymorpha subsp. ruderalis]|uniref:Uncharacterized protein n=1 Tax=Marchantia polymorpha subsp. ruderalis TaxID=1480154 RepID=A0A176WNI0_MARPO|nr:hypothetical protein AXG93_1593s1300 [Marchantia polymorpha subsp. ruderalis]